MAYGDSANQFNIPPSPAEPVGPADDDGPPRRISWLGAILIVALVAWSICNPIVGHRVLWFELALGLVLSLHVFTHYLASRLRGLAVERVSLFYGGALVRWQSGPTWFAIRWFPWGGYVKIRGMDDSAPSSRTDPTGYQSVAPPGRALLLISAPFAVLAVGAVILGRQDTWHALVRAMHDLRSWPWQSKQTVHAALAFIDSASLLQMIGVTAVWMALLNLLPLPMLNGGQALCELICLTRARRLMETLSLLCLLALWGYFLIGLYRLFA